jgi:dTDP-4-dehydrorhamnose 3,5-epimerase
MLDIERLDLEGVMLVTPSRHGDERGFFSEVYNRRAFEEAGIPDVFVQDNHSLSGPQGTVRGLHFQIEPNPIAKLVRVVSGAVYDVVVDLRTDSPTYGHHVGVELSADNWAQIYVPRGFAHGFCTMKPNTEVAYKVTGYWAPEVDKGVAWDDPDLAIAWPVAAGEATLSDKDLSQPSFADLPGYF